jgi:hypothetical protein
MHISRALMCGTERWYLKTLQDRPKLISAKPTTIAHLVGLPRPKPAPKDRSQFERHSYSLTGVAVTFVRLEADQDLHIVVQDAAGRHMIRRGAKRAFLHSQRHRLPQEADGRRAEQGSALRKPTSSASCSGTGRTR